MGYLRSKLTIFLSCRTLCSNKIISHDQGFLQKKFINGGSKLKSPRTYKSPANLIKHVGHGIARHASENLMRIFWLVALLLLIHLPAMHPQHTQKLSEILFSFLSLRRELEADYIGLMLMASAGYDPRVAPVVLEVWLGGDSGCLAATHPAGSKRANKLNKPKVMQKAVAIYEEARSGHGVTSFI